MKPFGQSTLAVLLGCLAVMVSGGKSQDYLPVADYGRQDQYPVVGHDRNIIISEASFNHIMSSLEELKAVVAEREKAGGWEDTSQEKWKVKFGGRVMADYVTWARQDPAYAGAKRGQNYLEARRARFRAEGEGYGIYFWQIELDFAADDDSSAKYDSGPAGLINVGPVAEMKDLYLGVHEIPLLGDVLIGHFKGPSSLEELTSSRYITFLERALPNSFVAGREFGIAASNRTASRNVTWSFGVFADGVPESTKQVVGNAIGTQVLGRATWTPWYDEPSGGRYLVHLGGGIRYVQDRNGLFSLRARPETHESIRVIDLDGDDDYADQYTVCNAELAWVHGPFSIQSELFVNVVDVADVGAQIPGNANAYGTYVQASYFLTGENRAYKRYLGTFGRVKPYTNFWIVRGAGIGSGAWEAKARWSYLDVSELYAAGFTGDGSEDAEKVNNMAVGFNWYWNPYTRLMFDYWHSWSKQPGLDAAEADLIGMRFQYDF